MRLAKWSGETAIEDQNYIRLAFEIRQAGGFSLKIFQRKIGGWCVY
jgi:hypothetical protein